MNPSITQNRLVTVGITTYNRPLTLCETLKSVCEQTYENLEIIVSDDCSSSHDTEKIVKDFMSKDPRVKYIRHNEHKFLTFNFNSLVKRTSGEYFLWLCDDDYIDPDYITTCIKVLKEQPSYILACGKTKFYLEDQFAYEGAKINVLENNPKDRVISFYDQVLGSGNPIDFGVIKTKHWRKVNMKNIMANDYILNAGFAFLGKIKTLEDVCIHRRLGGLSETVKKTAIGNSYSSFTVMFPFLVFFINIFKDIAWESPIYKPLGIFGRMFLALRWGVVTFLNIEKYMTRYKMRDILSVKDQDFNYEQPDCISYHSSV